MPAQPNTGPSDLLEREPELRAIDAALDAARQGDGRALLLEGPAGIGKTSLLSVAADRAKALGMTVLRARGEELERGFAWGVCIQLFAALVSADRSDDLLAGPAALTEPLFERARPPAEAAHEPFPLLHGLHWLLANLADRAPVLLVVDDAHFADLESLRLCHYLLGRLERLASVPMLAVRTGEPTSPEAAELLARLRAHPEVEVRRVAPISSQSVRSLLAAELPEADEELAEALATATAGNPLFCRELLRAMRSEGIATGSAASLRGLRAEGIRQSIMVQLGRLGTDAARLAVAVAILGHSARLPMAAELAGLDEEVAERATEALLEAGILTADGGLDFVHPLVREIVAGELSATAARRQHVEAARILDRHGAEPGYVAAHLIVVEPPVEEWAVTTLREAARTNLTRGAPAQAADLLRAALKASAGANARSEVLLELGRAEVAAGDPRGVERLREALQLETDGPAAVEIALSLGEALYAAGRFDEAASEFELALDLLEPLPAAEREPVTEARLLAGLDISSRLSGRAPERVRRYTDALVSSPPSEPSLAERVLMAMAAGEQALGVDRPREKVLELARGALAGDAPVEVLGRAVVEPVIAALMFCDQLEEADSILAALLERAGQRGEASGYISLVSFRGYVALHRGPLAMAVAYAEDAIRVADEIPVASRQALAPARHALARASLEQGDVPQAERAVDVPEAAELWGGSPLYGWFLDALGRVELARGRASEALDAFRSAGELFVAAGGPGTVCDWRSGAALAARAGGEIGEAVALADEELELARRFGAPRPIAVALRCRALLYPKAEQAIGPLREAVATVESSEVRVEHAKALVELGAALRRAGWDRDSREPLRSGLELARKAGATAWVERAATELEASGARRPRLALSGVEALTPGQRRVAAMAAGGMSNPEIAAALFVTRRTVETHLTAAFAKLGVSSRGELAGIAGLGR